MTTIVRTEFTVVSTDTEYTLPGDWSADTIKRNYAGQVPGLNSMTAAEQVVVRNGESIRVITFSPRTGTKG
ncbi:hypothetical protein D3C87_459870 [compost metagenome]